MAMVSTASSHERIDLPRSKIIDASPSRLSSHEVASERAPSSPDSSCAGDASDGIDPSNSSSSPNRHDENLSEVTLRNEEYRQLFRLPPEEILVRDYNCAYQESILLQGHMYLSVRYICFYSNIFGFETKKVIPFHEVTSVKRAKTAGIFPNAIEIVAGGKKYFFASFFSRDEAFKLIHDGWLEHGNDVKARDGQQDLMSESSSQENGVVVERASPGVVVEKASGLKNMTSELDCVVRDEDPPVLNDSEVSVIGENDGSPSHDNAEQHAEPLRNTGLASSTTAWTWKLEDSDPPKIAADYTKVGETKFQVTVEECFRLFFSDDAVSFVESFHTRCGDKEFRCTPWQSNDRFGHTREVSFQHPIKIYFGAKFGNCQEKQKFRVYRNSHLVIETSQEINNVPYGDYFAVEALWDVQRECSGSKEGCIVRVYVRVAFSKRTVWKGKIEHSTLEECREVYQTWIKMAHELLKQENLEKQEGKGPGDNLVQNTGVPSEREENTEECSERSHDSVPQMATSRLSVDLNPGGANLSQESLMSATVIASFFRDSLVKLCSLLRSQSRISQVLVIAFAVILLMQVTILVLLNRPQHVHVTYPRDYMGLGHTTAETMGWMEKRIHYLKDEMLMVESRLERMWHEHSVLKAQLKDLELLRKQR